MSNRWTGGFIQLYFDPLSVGQGIPGEPGFLYSFGRNNTGQLGLGDTTTRSSPVQVGLSKWSDLAAGEGFSSAIGEGGSIWAWGDNSPYGQLGLGDTTDRSVPVQIGALTTWLELSCGKEYVAALKTDGTMWTWGRNSYGELGQNNTTHYSSPVQVGAVTAWLEVSAGDYHTAAIKTDGTMWAFGRGNNGQLGQNNTTNYSSPVQVGALTTWAKVKAGGTHNIAVKTDGTLWGWGQNAYGQLGLGNTTYAYSSPVQVGALTNWAYPGKQGVQASNAIKTDGTLWSWGNNASGQLGLGDTTSRSSPTQVGALTDWLDVANNLNSTVAVKTDGTLWTYGYNGLGALGLGDTTGRSSPTQVGSLTSWSKVASGVYHQMATEL